LRRCKNGSRKKDNDVDALKCWNLERILDAELLNEPVPSDLNMEELIDEGGRRSKLTRVGNICFPFSS
jgi:hypothetical protein